MERALLAPLRRGPCLVSFSGGRDSSAVLAVATAVARREGLRRRSRRRSAFRARRTRPRRSGRRACRPPGPRRLDPARGDRRARLRRPGGHGRAGAPRPALAVERPLPRAALRAAHGGSFLTGIGGDELLGSSRWLHARRVLAGKVDRSRATLFAVAFALAPPRLRRPVTRRRMRAPFPWLHDDVVEQLERELANDEASCAVRLAPRHPLQRQPPLSARRHAKSRHPRRGEDVVLITPLPRARLRLGARRAAALRPVRQPPRRDGRDLRRRAPAPRCAPAGRKPRSTARSGTSTAASSSPAGTARASTRRSSTWNGCERNGRAARLTRAPTRCCSP